MISGDPGASDKYDFSITMSIPANDSVETKSRIVKFTALGGMSASPSVTQSAGDPYLRFVEEEVVTDWTGTPVPLHVESNIDWKIQV